ncbi:MAG: Ubiquinone/menaquinone biosynthesis C-methyltransferase UbiE [Ignavibacteria bacterium]|nr:Ubiquinone/menaquinone biosynthesis C-methyltransferase UbiE [Ignavibacteria bacterium]
MSYGKINDTIIFLPYLPEAESYMIPKSKEEMEICEQGLPVPPVEIRLGSVKKTENYLNWAKPQVKAMIEIAEKSGFKFSKGKRILDFGCGTGRMIRWLKPLSDRCEIWGTDINSEHIYWASRYLRPYFKFATTTTIPHLPFEDSYFDFIYAGSVFTHIDDLTDAWFLELKRILNSGGRLYITIHDQNSLRLLNSEERPDWKNSWLSKRINADPVYNENKNKFGVYISMRGPDSQVFYDDEFFKDQISQYYDILDIVPEAYGYQTAVLLKKKT